MFSCEYGKIFKSIYFAAVNGYLNIFLQEQITQ